MTGAQPLGSERLALTGLGPDDAPRIAALCNNWNVARWLARVPYPYLIADAERFCRLVADSVAAGRDLVWAIRQREDSALIGIVSVTGLQSAEPELGYWLGELYWGRGLMGEAAACATGAFFRQAAHARLFSGAFVGNNASLRIQQRLGFHETSRGRRYCLARDADIEHIFTALDRSAWRG